MVPGRTLRILLANAAGLPVHRLEELPIDVTHGLQRAWNRGYAVGESMGRRRDARARRIAAAISIALIVLAFLGGRASATPRSEPVIPSAPVGAASSDRAQSGASQPGILSRDPAPERPSSGVEGSAAPFDPSSFPPVGFGVPDPSGGLDELGSTHANPAYTPEPERTPPATRFVSHGTPADGIGGQATWWASFGSGLYAAIRPDLGTKGDTAIVCGGSPWHCLTLPIITTCACLGPGSGRLIDLSIDAFASFADPSAGVTQVVVQVISR